MNLGAKSMGGRYDEDGVTADFALHIDEWSNGANHGGHNDEAGDNGDHGVIMFMNGNNAWSDFGECTNRGGCAPVSLFEDAEWHSVAVTVSSAGFASFDFDSGMYGGEIQLDGYSLPSPLYIGFSGRTGGATNNHWVREVSVGTGTISAGSPPNLGSTPSPKPIRSWSSPFTTSWPPKHSISRWLSAG